MGDSDKTLKLLIELGVIGQADAEAANQILEETGAKATTAAAGFEQLSNTGAGLATSLPNLNEQTKAFTISTEREYIAVQKALETMTNRITVMQAAGKDVAVLVEAQQKLDAALSTENALLIAEQIEMKAAAAASAAKAAADTESAVASNLNAGAMREMVVVARELATGNYSRLAGSTSILAQKFDLLKYALSPMGFAIMGVGAAAYLLYEHIKEVNQELDQMAQKAATADFLPDIEKKIDVLESATAAAQEYSDKLREIANGEGDLNEKLKEELTLDSAIERARAALVSAQKELAIAKIQQAEASGQLTPEQAAEARVKAEKKAIDDEQAAREAAQDKELKDKQDALAKDKSDEPTLEKKADAAQAKVTGEEAHNAAVKQDPKELDKKRAEIQAQIDQANKIIAEVTGEDMGGGSEWGSVIGGLAVQGRNIMRGGESMAPKVIQEQQGKLESLKAQMDALQAQARQSAATQTPEAAAKLQADKDAADAAKKAAIDNATQQRELTEAIKSLRDIIAATRPIEHQTADTKKAAMDADEGTRIIGDFQRDRKTIDDFDNSKKPSSDLVARAAAAIQDMKSIMKDHTDLLKTIADLAPAIEALKKAQSILAGQNSAARNNVNAG